MTKQMLKTGEWFKEHSFKLIISLLLAIITYGGGKGINMMENFVNNQQKINEDLIIRTNLFMERCENINDKIQILNEVNLNHGIKILENKEKIIEHDVEIKHLKNKR